MSVLLVLMNNFITSFSYLYFPFIFFAFRPVKLKSPFQIFSLCLVGLNVLTSRSWAVLPSRQISGAKQAQWTPVNKFKQFDENLCDYGPSSPPPLLFFFCFFLRAPPQILFNQRPPYLAAIHQRGALSHCSPPQTLPLYHGTMSWTERRLLLDGVFTQSTTG